MRVMNIEIGLAFFGRHNFMLGKLGNSMMNHGEVKAFRRGWHFKEY